MRQSRRQSTCGFAVIGKNVRPDVSAPADARREARCGGEARLRPTVDRPLNSAHRNSNWKLGTS